MGPIHSPLVGCVQDSSAAAGKGKAYVVPLLQDQPIN